MFFSRAGQVAKWTDGWRCESFRVKPPDKLPVPFVKESMRIGKS
jgi:hypothetical protein